MAKILPGKEKEYMNITAIRNYFANPANRSTAIGKDYTQTVQIEIKHSVPEQLEEYEGMLKKVKQSLEKEGVGLGVRKDGGEVVVSFNPRSEKRVKQALRDHQRTLEA